MVNRFDEYVSSPYVSQYIPIPFEQIMAIGEKYNEQRRKAEENLAQTIQKFGTFKSASQSDMDNYYRETLGRMAPVLNELDTNPNAMKDPMFRSKISSLINNTDYNKLARYLETAQNLETYNKVKADMKSKGLFNLDWEDKRMANWNTDTEGVMNELAPIQYKSLQEITKPYVEGIKPTFYKGRAPISGAKMAFTNWSAITPKERFKELNMHLGDIMSTPQGKKWYETIQNRVLSSNPEATQKDVNDAFMSALMTVTAWKDAETPIVDTAGLNTHIANIKSGGNNPNNPSGVLTRVSKVQADAQKQLKLVNQGIIDNNQNYINALVNKYKQNPQNGKLTDEQLTKAAEMQVVNAYYQKYGTPENIKIPLLKSQYFDYWTTPKELSFLKDKSKADTNRQVENYSYRYGDLPLTINGKLLENINNGFVSDDGASNSKAPGGYSSYLATPTEKKKTEINTTSVENILQNLGDNAKFEPDGEAFSYNQTEDYDPRGNVIKATGQIYVKEKDLKEAIEKVNPDQASAYMSLFTKGFEENGEKKYKLAEKVKGATPDGEDDWYVIKLGRSWGHDGQLNDRFNSMDIKDLQGTSQVKDNNVSITGISQQEATSNPIEFDSNSSF